MLPFKDIVQRLSALESALRQMVRIGFVTEVLPEEGKVRVQLRDADCLETFVLPVLVHKTRCDKDYWMPDLGEHVVCVFLPIGLQVGFVLGAFYSIKDLTPEQSPDKHHLRYLDGTWLEYDRASGDLQVHCRGRIVLAAGEGVTIRSPQFKAPPLTVIGPGEPELRPVEPSPIPEPRECPYG